ncbi:MAG: radical SAM protein [Candidatus Bathyarchaeota archaeon]|nr:radical SAM protein [Candidatus Bathyarchaeota archaeon]
MCSLSAEAIWNASQPELEQLLNSGSLVSEPKKIRFYAPSFTYYKTASFCNSNKEFPTISVTGNGCALNCKHCGGKVLETMHPADTPEKLLQLCADLKREGALGVLVSGGCLPDGSVPLGEFMPALAKVKRDLGLTVFVHTGIVDEETARQLKSAGVDAALIDVIGSDETIKEIYNLNVTAKQYEDSLKALHEAGIAFVPHVIAGLHHGELKGELAALQMIKPYEPAAVVIISFMPIHGTAMAQTKPPTPQGIARTAATARVMFPETPLVLGCMRPKGKHRAETDVLALKAGADGVAFPSEAAIQYAKTSGFEVDFSAFCCAQIYQALAGK